MTEMSKTPEIKNAKIEHVSITMADHGCLTFYITLNGGGWGCNFGGYCIGNGYLGWISVEERLPEKTITACLVYADGRTQVADWTHDKWGEDWWFYVDGEYDPEITHWMPMPEPPKEE